MDVRRPARVLTILTLAFAFAGLEPWTATSLPAHMIQHLLLMVVIAPLAVVGWAPRHPPRWAHGTAFAAVALALQTLALLAWHVPDAFNAADQHVLVHFCEHASLLLTAIAVWWVILASKSSLGVRFGALVVSAAPMMLLGVLMTFAVTPWYAAYASVTDQQTAGALMWGPSGLSYVIAAAWLVGTTIHNDERRFTSANRG